MKHAIPALCIVFATVLLLVCGVSLGVSYERHYVKLWRGTALDCIEEWVECRETCEEGVRL